MPNNYDNIDCWWTSQGDFVLDGGDLKDTSEDGLRSLVQDLTTISKSSVGDWKLLPGLGANVDESLGKPNSQATGQLLHDRLRIAIVSAGVVAEEDLFITVIPVSRDEMLIIERVRANPTPYNRLGQGQVLTIELVYSSQEKNMYIVEASLSNIYQH